MSNILEKFEDKRKNKLVTIHDSEDNELLFCDVTISENHSMTSQVTMHEVEEGDQISDHVVKKGVQLTLNGVISDDPINLAGALTGTAAGAYGSLIGGTFGAITTGALSKLSGNLLKDAPKRVKTAYDALWDIYNKKILCTIITGLTTHKNMILESLNIPRDKTTTGSLIFTATFRQVEIIASEAVKVTSENIASEVRDSASPVKKQGNKSTITPTEAVQDKAQSWLISGLEYTGLI